MPFLARRSHEVRESKIMVYTTVYANARMHVGMIRYVRMFACAVCMYAFMQVCKYASMHVCMYGCIDGCMDACMDE